ncbi:MAG: radical SAM protein [Bryobacteraceae bacterium]
MLIGIAKLAAASPLLDSKRLVEYFELPHRTLLNRTKPIMPFRWAINPYRGCEFGCHYCYARYTHEFMGMEDGRDFEYKIYAKAYPAEILRRELSRVPREDGIAIGTATDPYQPAERRYGKTRAILEVFARDKGRRLFITTKSDLAARDVELLAEISRVNVLHVNMTITTLDDNLARLLEPRAPRPDLRLATVRTLASAGISIGVFPNPILPFLTDSVESLDRVAEAAAQAGATYFGGGILFLMPCAQKILLPFLNDHFPEIALRYRKLYARGAYLRGPYQEAIRQRLRGVRERHGLRSSPADYQPADWNGEEQLSLFPVS